jgi:viroplasmin and RNaseH domain-containing protein
MAKKQCYVVYKGKVAGMYDEWPECQALVEGVSGASHKGFKSRQEAKTSYLRFTLARERTHNHRLMYFIVSLSLIVIALLAYIIV